MPENEIPHSGTALFAAVVFLGAFLLFQVQPLIGKAIVPWFGGSPSVWNSCLLFFQVVLFFGYVYAYLSYRLLGLRGQLLLHLGLVAVAVACLSILPGPEWAPEGTENPVWLALRLLAATVGLPFFVLAGSGPLFQAWYSRLHPGRIPYRLYALANASSLVALFLYPFLIDPLLATRGQSRLWSGLFVVFGLLALACAVTTWRSVPVVAAADRAAERQPAASAATAVSVGRPWQWLAWSASGVILFMSVTNRLCLDIAAVPFLWILPLSIYLLSFTLAFSGRRFYRRHVMTIAMFLLMPVLFQVGADHINLMGLVAFRLSTAVQVGMLLVVLAVFELVCHGELYRLRPPAGQLTGFYVFVAGGGCLGGLFVVLAAPVVFPLFQELTLGAVAAGGLMLWGLSKEPDGFINRGNRRLRRAGASIGYATCVVLLVVSTGHLPQPAIFTERNHHGAIYVTRLDAEHPRHDRLVMRHGTTKHGVQYLRPAYRRIPTTYYSPFTGGGLSLLAYQQTLGYRRPMHVGIIGLGIGTLAAYARPGDRYRFYEIDPLVARVATASLATDDDTCRFTYLNDCRGDVRIVLGDARLKMEQELQVDRAGQRFDFLVLDAFNSDAIPVHLLTREAFAVYRNHLKEDGVIALHISSNNFDLRKVCYQLALENEFEASLIINKRRAFTDQPEFDCDLSLISSWCILYRNPEFLDKFQEVCRPLMDSGEISGEKACLSLIAGFRPWTDQYSNLLEVFER